jgi:hypothetical protein
MPCYRQRPRWWDSSFQTSGYCSSALGSFLVITGMGGFEWAYLICERTEELKSQRWRSWLFTSGRMQMIDAENILEANLIGLSWEWGTRSTSRACTPSDGGAGHGLPSRAAGRGPVLLAGGAPHSTSVQCCSCCLVPLRRHSWSDSRLPFSLSAAQVTSSCETISDQTSRIYLENEPFRSSSQPQFWHQSAPGERCHPSLPPCRTSPPSPYL